MASQPKKQGAAPPKRHRPAPVKFTPTPKPKKKPRGVNAPKSKKAAANSGGTPAPAAPQAPDLAPVRVELPENERALLASAGITDPRHRNPNERPAHVLNTKFSPGNPYRFQPGVSGNPSGRPKSLSNAYKAWLELADPESGLTNAQLAATSLGERMIDEGDAQVAREFRQATEGETFNFNTMTDAQLLQEVLATRKQVNDLLARAQTPLEPETTTHEGHALPSVESDPMIVADDLAPADGEASDGS